MCVSCLKHYQKYGESKTYFSRGNAQTIRFRMNEVRVGIQLCICQYSLVNYIPLKRHNRVFIIIYGAFVVFSSIFTMVSVTFILFVIIVLLLHFAQYVQPFCEIIISINLFSKTYFLNNCRLSQFNTPVILLKYITVFRLK